MSTEIAVGRHVVGMDHPVYFIADIAANHDGDLERAKDLIWMCADAGAHAAKFQNFTAKTIVSDYGFRNLDSKQSHQAAWSKSVFDVYDDASLPMQWTPILKETCDKAGIDYFTAPYDLFLLDELAKYVAAWKVGSGDITWHENIEAMSQMGKPVILATGATEMTEVRMAVDAVHRHTRELILMQCNTNYTASLENFHHIALNVLKTYAREFPGVILGLSDHTPGHATVLGAVALGARAVEKHFTDDINHEGPDHKFSMDPQTWRDMVDRTNELDAALGREDKVVMENELDTVVLQRRALRATRTIAAGERLLGEHIAPLRPCPPDAVPPYRINEIIGKTAKTDIEEGDCIRLSEIS